MAEYPKIQDLSLRGRRVLVRVDFNVPLRAVGEQFEVSDDTRIEGALPTIRYLKEQSAKIILASHLGRPKGKFESKYSLEPAGARLSEKLNQEVFLAEDCIGDSPKAVLQRMGGGDILLLENLRFHAGEEQNSRDFASRLLELFDVYVGDAFGTLHRAHASTDLLPRMAPERCIGHLVQRELEYLEPLRERPERPFVLIMGGSKVSDKMGVIEHFLSKIDTLMIGGAMAYAFLKAHGIEIGKSLCEDAQVSLAEKILKSVSARDIQLLLPIDHVISRDIKGKDVQTTKGAEIPADFLAADLGPKTIALYCEHLKNAQTIFWNGPMGVFEVPAFSKGTFELARAISESSARKMAGGGDVAAAISASGCEKRFDFISTGGGATLEFLEGQQLPGLMALEV